MSSSFNSIQQRAENIILATQIGQVLESVIEEIDQETDIPRHFLLPCKTLNFTERFVFTQLELLRCTQSEAVTALVILDRILYEESREGSVTPTRLNFIVALLLAMKMNREEPVSNQAATFSSKYTIRQINKAEKNCLKLMNHKIFVSQAELLKYSKTLLTNI